MRRNLELDIEIKLVDTPTGVTSYVAGDFDLGIWGYGFNIADPDDWVNAIYGPGARNYTAVEKPGISQTVRSAVARIRQGETQSDPAPDGAISADQGRPLHSIPVGALVLRDEPKGENRDRSVHTGGNDSDGVLSGITCGWKHSCLKPADLCLQKQLRQQDAGTRLCAATRPGGGTTHIKAR